MAYNKCVKAVHKSWKGYRRLEPHDALMAPNAEISAEHARAKSRVLKRSKRRSNTFRSLLAPSERKFLSVYIRKWKARFGIHPRCDRNCFFMLSDNPDRTPTWSAHGRLPAFKKSAGKLWSESAERWLTPLERMAALGFPVYPRLAQAAQCPVLEFEFQSLSAMAGNAWHCANAGMVLMCALACTQMSPRWG
jgi:hypothetical protein